MINSRKKMICVIGLGNTLRGDDGIAAYVCNALESAGYNHVAIHLTQQLDISWAEKLKTFRDVIIVDASVNNEDVEFKKIETGNTKQQSSSHHIHPGILAALTNQLYKTDIHFYTCAIKGYDFEFEERLSEQALANANKAVALIKEFLNNDRVSE